MKIPNSPCKNIYIDIIAPGGKVSSPAEFEKIHSIVKKWGCQGRMAKNIQGNNHVYLSNTVDLRFEDIKKALYASDSQVIWCYRGGSGSAELLPLLHSLVPPPAPKIFLGFSDITALHAFFNQVWNWPTFHGPCAYKTAMLAYEKSTQLTVQRLLQENIYFQPNCKINLHLKPLNTTAKTYTHLTGKVTGGNLTVICQLFGTPYQLITDYKILLLEDINEPAYKIRRMLTQLKQAGVFNNLMGLIWGKVSGNNTKDNQEIYQEIKAFSLVQQFPVFQTSYIGHGTKNKVIPLNHFINITVRH